MNSFIISKEIIRIHDLCKSDPVFKAYIPLLTKNSFFHLPQAQRYYDAQNREDTTPVRKETERFTNRMSKF